ncbi:hypothetical protein BM1_04709 [Bipolaris maydis]|nr:hypothetical protein BM1_04709 [Bipolaris maydis]
MYLLTRLKPLTRPQTPGTADKLNSVCKTETVGIPKAADLNPDPDRLETTERKRLCGDVLCYIGEVIFVI